MYVFALKHPVNFFSTKFGSFKYFNLLFTMNAGGIIGNSDSARELSGNFLEYIEALHFKQTLIF